MSKKPKAKPKVEVDYTDKVTIAPAQRTVEPNPASLDSLVAFAVERAKERIAARTKAKEEEQP